MMSPRELAHETAIEAERKGGCPATWGNCVEGEKLLVFGPPSDTPHVCKGVKRHKSKLHLCDKCGRPGHRIAPTAFSKAGRQFRSVLRGATR